MLPSSRVHHLLNKSPRHTMALRGQMNILGTLSFSPSGGPTATSWSRCLGKRAESSLQDSIFSCQIVHQHDGQDREQLAHKDWQQSPATLSGLGTTWSTRRSKPDTCPLVWRTVYPPACRLPALGGGLHPLQAARHVLISFCKCKWAFSAKAALGLHRLKGSLKDLLNK